MPGTPKADTQRQSNNNQGVYLYGVLRLRIGGGPRWGFWERGVAKANRVVPEGDPEEMTSVEEAGDTGLVMEEVWMRGKERVNER